jgi:hypothetical protein
LDPLALVGFIARESGVFGDNPWGHGLTTENQVVLDKFVQYAESRVISPIAQSLAIFLPPIGR